MTGVTLMSMIMMFLIDLFQADAERAGVPGAPVRARAGGWLTGRLAA
jgi:hypothetical protein